MKAAAVPARRRENASIGVGILITLAVALCALCVFQWWDAARLRKLVEDERKVKRDVDIQLAEKDQANKRYSDEIARLEALRKDLDESVKTNKAEVSHLKADLKRNELELGRATNSVNVYKDALDKANEAIRQQNESVKQQNDAIKKIAEERAELATKYNKLAEDYNKVVTDFNTLVEQVKKEHAAAAAAAEKEKK
jgi:chromosome segregation ATPase